MQIRHFKKANILHLRYPEGTILWTHGPVIRALDSRFMGTGFKSTGCLPVNSIFQPSVISQQIPGTPGDLMVKSKMSPHSVSAVWRQLNPIHGKRP